MYYKDPQNKIHAIDSIEFEYVLPSGSVQITDEDAEAMLSTAKTPEQIRDSAKLARSAAVAAIIVTTSAGNTFDGDEVAQGRMVRAVMAMQATSTATTPWVLADNTVVQASAAELLEALALAGSAQSSVWVIL